MKSIVCALAVCVGGLVWTSQAEAGPGHAHGPRPAYARHGVRFSGGYYYPGRAHSHWRYRVYNSHFRRYHYWDAHRRCYYYYCPVRLGYYPVVVTPTCAAGFGNAYATQFNY